MKKFVTLGLLLCALVLGVPLSAAQLQMVMPLQRTDYQTNEVIDLMVVRSDAQALPADLLSLTVIGDDGSRIQFTFPVGAVAVAGNAARASEHLKLNGWLLRPGRYTLEASAHGTSVTQVMTLYTHLRRSSFILGDWGSKGSGVTLTLMGEDGMGFNILYGEYRVKVNRANAAATLRGGMDYMQNCTMSGAHQMDLRAECDWSDPLVVRGGTARVVQQAFHDRTQPNAVGVHFYDEPGLTWIGGSPHTVPAQHTAFKAAFGVESPKHNQVKADDAAMVEAWHHWGRWKEAFMEAAWTDARMGVEKVSPKLLSVTQSVYAFNAYTDGYYFNVHRSLPIISGHGGYSDGPASYFYPSYHHEFGRMRDLDKPNWYLPSWYVMESDIYRLEQYLSFQTGLQGMFKPPWHKLETPAQCTSSNGIVEVNKLMTRLGPIFNTLPVARGEVAMLYSLSQNLDAQIKSGMTDNYEGGGHSRGQLLSVYLAGKMIHVPFDPIVEEDVLDGTLAAQHKAVILAGINYLDAPVVRALELYSARGGTVLVTADCQVQIAGAVKLAAEADVSQYRKIQSLWRENQQESVRQRAAEYFMKITEPLAAELKTRLLAIGIQPVAQCDNSRVVITRQGIGDILYYFAVNAAGNPAAGPLALVPTQARITLPGGALYDAVRGGAVQEIIAERNDAPQQTGQFRFGPGQMRVFAHTSRPIGSVQLAPITVKRDFVRDADPIRIELAATLLDTTGKVLYGSAPMQVTVADPLGNIRYDLYRATDRGEMRLTLPLAANDPAGDWNVTVTELLANTSGVTTFTYTPAPILPTIAGAQRRAVYFGNERDNIYRFFRSAQSLTLLVGSGAYNQAAAERLAAIVKPWGVQCTIQNASEVNKPREITAEEARTWVGMEFGRVDVAKPTVYKQGFAVDGSVVLFGTPADNPLIAKVQDWGFLPYPVTADFPGRGRGYLAWQLSAVGINQESITLIASDEAGMSEAVGTLFEALAGLNPATPFLLPAGGEVTAANVKPVLPVAPAIAWSLTLPDRALSISAGGNGDVTVLTSDGTETVINAAGNQQASKVVDDATLAAARKAPAAVVAPAVLKDLIPADRLVKYLATAGPLTAIGYWGGTLQIFQDDVLLLRTLLPQDITGLVWTGETLVAGLSDGRVIGIKKP